MHQFRYLGPSGPDPSSSERERKPIAFRSRTGDLINCLIASKTTLKCLSYFPSNSLSRRDSSALEASICRSFTKARIYFDIDFSGALTPQNT